MNIFEKLLKIQQEARVTKDMHNDFGRFNYRNAEMIFEALKPICLKYGAVLRVTDDVEEKCGKPYIKAIARWRVRFGIQFMSSLLLCKHTVDRKEKHVYTGEN